MKEHDLLTQLCACREAVQFCSGHETLEAAWLACERADWLLWFAAKRKVDRKLLVLIACECARTALPYTKDPRVLACIETAEKWTRGEATIEGVREARRNADAAAAAADAAYAAAAAAAADAAYAACRSKALKQCAEIVRKHIPQLP